MGSEEVRLMLTDILEATEPGDFVTTHGVSGSEKEGKWGRKRGRREQAGGRKGGGKEDENRKRALPCKGVYQKKFF